MNPQALHRLAQAVGLSASWLDYRGERRVVADSALQILLARLGYPAETKADVATALEQVTAERRAGPPMITALRNKPVQLRGRPGWARLELEDGRRSDVTLREDGGGCVSFRAPEAVGYHRLQFDDGAVTLATAPERAPRVADLTAGRPVWGAAVQLYSLNGGGDFGDFGDLERFAVAMAGRGADAVAVSPTHALFTADLGRYAPYSPSTRLFLNPLFAALPHLASASPGALIDWPAGSGAKLLRLRGSYAAFAANGAGRDAFETFVRDGGDPLLGHARFEALDARFRPQGLGHWRDWPGGYADAAGSVVQDLAPSDPEVEFHLFLQWRVAVSARDAQAAALAAGMSIGLISDLAVGMDGAGSHAWSRPRDVLQGLCIGAPPDLLAEQGQSWGLTTFSPHALQERGFGPFLDTLRAALRHAGGVRIDHAIGLQRLWIMPQEGRATDGAYLSYPFESLLRLIALECHRRGAVVIGEDLGTVQPSFRDHSTQAGMAGMRVLWFERTLRGGFRSPSRWGRRAVAMTTTHDLPTVGGWWTGRDLQERADPSPSLEFKAAQSHRSNDRSRLWRSMIRSGAAKGEPPLTDAPGPVIDAAIAHVASSDCDLALIAIEDILGLVEQPNVPGSIDDANWRRRLPADNGLDDPKATARLKTLARARGR